MRVIFTQTLKSCSIAAGVRVEWILKAVALQSESLEIGIDFINASGWLLHPGWCSYQSTSSISGGSSRCVMTPRMRSGHRSQYNTSPAALLQYRRLQLQPELRPLLHVEWPWEGLCFSAPCCQSNVELEWGVQVEIRFTFGTRAYCTDSNELDLLCACCHGAVSWSSAQEFLKNLAWKIITQ